MTKKISLLIVLLCTASWALAQDVMMPKKGNISIEIGFNPFSESFETFKLDGAKLNGRYFITDKDAVVLGLGLNYKLNKDKGEKWNSSENKLTFALDLGYERHWFVSRRVDLFATGIAGFEMRNSKSKHTEEYSDRIYTHTVKGGSENDPDYSKLYINLGGGINVYLIKGLYVGAALGLEMNHKNFKDYITETSNDGKVDTSKRENNQTETSIKFDVRPSLHLGWTF